ncbi:MAG TPA: hypothetical protein PKA77_17395 [Chitinophagaceae bacterium]|jgi:TATA-box binding protein (TBP) (component of TFIID and TFIIIB)|nr:hypothetical protein [Chitinophagaceae bacterium]HMU59371.1 hypothetical protein [Chitinophagaceae bacterium]
MKIVTTGAHRFENINPNSEKLTVDKLRIFPGCEGYTDAEAENIIASLELLSEICYNAAKENKTHSIDNQLTVSLCPKKTAA